MSEAGITGTPKLHDSVVDKEYAAAKKEGRQPNCPYCGEPLELVMEGAHVCWAWDEVRERYVMGLDSTSTPPYCVHCGKKDWDFIDTDLVVF